MSSGSKWLQLLKSRKFWAAIVAIAVVVIGTLVGTTPDQIDPAITEEMMTKVILVIISYIIGTGIEDSGLMTRR
jgi:hypothetical protein